MKKLGFLVALLAATIVRSVYCDFSALHSPPEHLRFHPLAGKLKS